MTRFTTVRRRVAATFVVSVLAALSEAHGQELKIGIIDFYGLRRVSTAHVREALTFTEGDAILMGTDDRPAFLGASEARLSGLADIARARINVVCCDQGRAIVFVGIEERGSIAMHFRAAPTGKARLADDIVGSGREFFDAFMPAIQRGDSAEDHSEGHAFNHDPLTRAIQERFVVYAKRDLPQLRRVLRTSSDGNQRALAAQVLGYTSDKNAVVEDLVRAMRDPYAEVRNNAMRTLMVFADAKPGSSASVLRIPAEPFIDFLNSPEFSDRNKASGALMKLAAGSDLRLLAAMRKRGLASLVEMARWKSAGHALAAFTILGRIAGYSDEAAADLWDRGDREVVITAAMQRR